MVVWDLEECIEDYKEKEKVKSIPKIKKEVMHDIRKIVRQNAGREYEKTVLVEQLSGTDEEGNPALGVWVSCPVNKYLHNELLQYARTSPYNVSFRNLAVG
jgi:hypothetical protein